MLREIERIHLHNCYNIPILLWIIIFQTLLANMLRKSIDIPLSNPYIVEKLCSKYPGTTSLDNPDNKANNSLTKRIKVK